MYQSFPDHNAVVTSAEPGYRWRYDARARIKGGFAIVGGTLYAETFAPSVIALNRRSGKLLWRTAMPNLVMTTPIVARGLVIVGTGRDAVALDLRTGRLLWSTPIQGVSTMASAAAAGGRVYVVAEHPRLRIFPITSTRSEP